MPLNKDWREFLELLNSNEVEYLVIGAFAVAFHGFPRYTADLDLLIRPNHENADRVLRALSKFGFGKLGIQASGSPFARHGGPVGSEAKPYRSVDHHLPGQLRRGVGDTQRSGVGRDCHALYWPCGIAPNKEQTGRAKDLGDAEELRKRATEQDG